MGRTLPLPDSAALIMLARLGFWGAWSLLYLLLFWTVVGSMESESTDTDRMMEGLARGDKTLAVFRLTPCLVSVDVLDDCC